MNICVIGAGYVGLVTGTCLADLGNNVICVDNNRSKVESLKKGRVTIYEPGLQELVKKNKRQSRLAFTTNIKEGIEKSTVIFIAVGTPSKPSGEADLTDVGNVAKEIAGCMKSYKLIVEKSTVPIETGTWIERVIKANIKRRVPFDVASNPEFLREGSAISDFMRPDRIVIGVNNKRSKDILLKVYMPLKSPILVTNIKSAELIKHASNSFLAAKISFINAISNICESTGADILEVARGMGMDKRIGPSFLDAGIGFGGFCFPKDLLAFIHISSKLGYDFRLLKEVERINRKQKELFVNKIRLNVGNLSRKTIAILGLSFKPDTDDIRYAPSLDVIRSLRREGAAIKVFDPHAMKKAKDELKGLGVKFCKDAYDAARSASCLVIVTEWNEFKELDFARIGKLLKKKLIIDGRNIYNPGKMRDLGFEYVSVGRRK